MSKYSNIGTNEPCEFCRTYHSKGSGCYNFEVKHKEPTKYETLEQAARDYDRQHRIIHLGSNTFDISGFVSRAFIAGASWREQQASVGFQEWESKLHEYEAYDFDFFSGLKAWQASQLSSAKLLAEKDTEIEKLNFIISFVLFNTRSNYIDKESRELFKKLTKDFEPAISWNQFRQENAEKIKTILGEE